MAKVLGKFITLEGGEGAGKSTQVQRLAKYVRSRGIEVVETREVGGCPSAEEIRELWLGKADGYWDPLTELMLIMAARNEHLIKTVRPALLRGAWVISDRFIDSTRAYQGIGLKIGLAAVNELYQLVAGGLEPDITLLLDLPVEIGMTRVSKRKGQDDRYQQKDLAFHQTLRDAYLLLAGMYPERIKTIDARMAETDVEHKIKSTIEALIQPI